MIGASRRHLGEIGEGYFEHLRFAAKVGAVAIGGGLACFAHALVPGLFTTTGSSAIAKLNQMIEERRRRTECQGVALPADRRPASARRRPGAAASTDR